MKKIFDEKRINSYTLSIIIFFFITINLVYFYLNLKGNTDVYAFNELFINYQAGFIRRGLLGEIFWQLNSKFSVNPKFFFSQFFLIIHLLQIFIFFYLFKKYILSKSFFIFIIFSPSLLLFHIYSPDLYFLKDSIIKLVFLFHAFIFYEVFILRKDKEKYFLFLYFIIIPLLAIVILIHEYQVFSLGLHFLITAGTFKNKSDMRNSIKSYSFLLLPIFLIIIFFGDQSQFENLSKILEKFDVELNPYLGGGLYHYIGGFYKWHFFYFTYRDFLNLFASFILSVLIFYVLFEYMIKNKIISFYSKYQINYLYYFAPVTFPFLLTSDHGRNLGFISFYLICFFLILKLNERNFLRLTKRIFNNIFYKTLIFVFIFFYIFMWKLDQVAGFGLQGNPNDIFQSSLFSEFTKFIKYLYIFIDTNFINLPEIKL